MLLVFVTGHARIRKLEKRDSETGMSADSETVIRKLGEHDSETGPAQIRKLDKHDLETGMSADSETVILPVVAHSGDLVRSIDPGELTIHSVAYVQMMFSLEIQSGLMIASSVLNNRQPL